jgi:hypothetical protein
MAKVRVSVSWLQELVGDEKDTDRFYLRLVPRFKVSRAEMHPSDFGAKVKNKLQKELNAKKGK